MCGCAGFGANGPGVCCVCVVDASKIFRERALKQNASYRRSPALYLCICMSIYLYVYLCACVCMCVCVCVYVCVLGNPSEHANYNREVNEK